MGRTSKLNEDQWRALGSRLMAGEKAADLAREFGVSKSSISERFSEQIRTVRKAAGQLVEAERVVRSLPIAEQKAARSLADHLLEISFHLAGAANYGAATAHRLSGIAHANVQKIDDAAPLDAESLENLKGVAVLTKMANEASVIGTALLNANKEAIRDLNSGAGQTKEEMLREIATLLPN